MSKKITSALIVLGISLSTFGADVSLAKTPKPTKAQIEAAKKEEAAKAEAAKKAAAVLSSATKTLNQLTAISNAAQVSYNNALKELAVANANARAAAIHAAKTQAQVSKTTRVIGKMAASAYKLGGDFTNINALL
ncbi:MAG: NlpC/P60 family protein, partial [Actinobacteria bacterium]|nr:NlpC/P60 family protein [Actinomycetota bacterium]